MRARLHDVRSHDIRHSYASRALALGESLTMIGKLLGHTQVQTTARYAHLARDSIQTAAARITGSIGGICRPIQMLTKIDLPLRPTQSTTQLCVQGPRPWREPSCSETAIAWLFG